MSSKQGIKIERQVLLFEIERRCSFDECNARNFLGLTKQEAAEYTGYECTTCERWNTDALKPADIPDWWEELSDNANKITH
jgi:hypothetical protein